MRLRDPKTGRFVKKPAISEPTNIVEQLVEPFPKPRLREWTGGRRIVEIDFLAKQLSQCSDRTCKSPLDLKNIEAETHCGFGSYFHIRCGKCDRLNRIKTCETHKTDKDRQVFNVNTLVASAIIDAGISIESLQKFAASLDIHPPQKRTLKRSEREIGPIIEKIARASCEGAVDFERELTVKKK